MPKPRTSIAVVAPSACLCSVSYQGCAQVEFKPDDGSESHTNHDGPDSHDRPRRGISFHGSSLFLQPLGVLIERIYRFIDATDGGRCSSPSSDAGPRHDPGAEPASPVSPYSLSLYQATLQKGIPCFGCNPIHTDRGPRLS